MKLTGVEYIRTAFYWAPVPSVYVAHIFFLLLSKGKISMINLISVITFGKITLSSDYQVISVNRDGPYTNFSGNFVHLTKH